MNPYPAESKDFKVVDQVGEALGKEVLRVHATIKTTPTPGLAIASRTLVYQDRNDPNREGSALLQSVTLANAAMVTVPGEYFAEAGMEFKRRSPYPNNMILGLTGGMVGYIPQKEAYRHGGYGVDAAPEMPAHLGMKQVPEGFAEVIRQAWLEMVYERWNADKEIGTP